MIYNINLRLKTNFRVFIASKDDGMTHSLLNYSLIMVSFYWHIVSLSNVECQIHQRGYACETKDTKQWTEYEPS